MPSESEIIEFLRNAKANQPGEFERYMEFYKTKHPDFYKKKLVPVFETNPEPVKEKVEAKPTPNPADALNQEIQPLGSANVGEMPSEKKKETKPKVKSASGAIKKDNKNMKIAFVVLGIMAAISVIVAIVYFVFINPL